MPGGLVRHYQHQRDHTPDPDRRRDAERVLEDLRSLCRAAQAHEEHDEHATLTGFLEQAAGLHAQELDAATRPADHRLDDPPGEGHRGAGRRAARLRGGAAAVVAVDLLAGPRAARRGAAPVLRRRHPRQGPAADHPRRRARPAPDRRPLPVPHRSRAPADAQLARRLRPATDGHAARDRPATSSRARARVRPSTQRQEIHMPNHNHANVNPPARTHAEAAALFRRPFAPGAIGFRAMTKVAVQRPAVRRRAGRRLHRRAVGDPAAERGRPRPLAPAVPDAAGRVHPGRQPAGVPRVPADRHAPGRGGRARRRRRLRGPRRDGLGLVRRRQGAVLRRAQARRGRRRDRRLPVHLARGGRAADRPARHGRCSASAGRARATCSSSRPRPSSGCATATRRG